MTSDAAIDTDAYFSVNATMSQEQIRGLPRNRVRCETGFPARKVRARKPAETAAIEQLLSQALETSQQEVHAATWRNLRTLSERSGAIERLPERIADTLLFL